MRLVSFPHCSNLVAEVNPVREICELVREAGAFSCVDGVSYAPHGLPDVGALGADIYLFSAYKTYGPHQGIMVIRRALAELLPNQAHFFNGDVLYKKFTPAGPDHAQVAASAGMADYVDALCDHHGFAASDPAQRTGFVHDMMRRRETALLQPLLDALSDRNAVRLIGPSDAGRRAPTVALALNGSAESAAEALARAGIMAGAGDFYAVRPLSAMGVTPEQGVLRLSFTHYTSQAELDRLVNVLEDVL